MSNILQQETNLRSKFPAAKLSTSSIAIGANDSVSQIGGGSRNMRYRTIKPFKAGNEQTIMKAQ